MFGLPDGDCPNAAAHTPQPVGYMDWHKWAAGMSKGFRQVRCTDCGLLNIWVARGRG